MLSVFPCEIRCALHNERLDRNLSCGACAVQVLRVKEVENAHLRLPVTSNSPPAKELGINRGFVSEREVLPAARRRVWRNLSHNVVRYYTAFGKYDGKWYNFAEGIRLDEEHDEQ